jgi:hypothetical protein
MSRARPLDLQRLRHVDGELLRSRDLRDEIAGDLELHWWHQRALHEAYGVVAGLDLSGPIDGQVLVAPGLAYDGRGRDLLLLNPATIALPAADAAMALVLAYRAGRPGVALRWAAPGRVDPCDGLVLAVLDPGPPPVLRPTARRTRPVARPRMGWGSTPPDATAWVEWVELRRMRLARGVQVAIDTRAAGFTDLPCYFAWLQWPSLAAAPADGAVEFDLLGLQYVQNESVDGFTFRVVVARPNALFFGRSGGAGVGDSVSFARNQQLHVCWLGIQCDDDATTGA